MAIPHISFITYFVILNHYHPLSDQHLNNMVCESCKSVSPLLFANIQGIWFPCQISLFYGRLIPSIPIIFILGYTYKYKKYVIETIFFTTFFVFIFNYKYILFLSLTTFNKYVPFYLNM